MGIKRTQYTGNQHNPGQQHCDQKRTTETSRRTSTNLGTTQPCTITISWNMAMQNTKL